MSERGREGVDGLGDRYGHRQRQVGGWGEREVSGVRNACMETAVIARTNGRAGAAAATPGAEVKVRAMRMQAEAALFSPFVSPRLSPPSSSVVGHATPCCIHLSSKYWYVCVCACECVLCFSLSALACTCGVCACVVIVSVAIPVPLPSQLQESYRTVSDMVV